MNGLNVTFIRIVIIIKDIESLLQHFSSETAINWSSKESIVDVIPHYPHFDDKAENKVPTQ